MMRLETLPRYFIPLLVLAPLLSRAQVVTPLAADPGRTAPAAAAARPAALTLPFFDDFAGCEGAPNTQRWLARGGVLVNNRFPVAPPTQGAATFDGLDANGRPYGPLNTGGDTDTLTSQPINLAGLTATDRVQFSFFWQAGSVLGAPASSTSSRPVSLALEFLDNTGIWRQVWVQRNTVANQRTNFAQQFIALTDSRYLHAGFQFRFHSTGDRFTSADAWSVDYVLLNRNRTATSGVSYPDIATSQPLNSALKRFTAMPVWQYNAAPTPTDELNDQVQTTLNNLDAGPSNTPVSWAGTLRVLPAATGPSFTNGSRSLAPNQAQVAIAGSLRGVPVPLSAAPKQLVHSFALQTNETNPLTLANDTISRRTDLTNYYAYDDGTPEAAIAIGLFSSGANRYLAHRYPLNKPDQVRSIRIYPLPLAAGRTITVNVWDDDNGRPAAQPKASKSYTIPATLPVNQPFLEVNFDAPVAVSGTFYAGYGHGATGTNNLTIQMGLDLNNAPPANSLFYFADNTWTPFSTAGGLTPAGSMLVRPVMTDNLPTSVADARTAAAYQVYPNPSPGRVQVVGRYVRAAVVDALGRLAWQQPAAEAGQPELNLSQLAPGVYLLRLTLADGQTVIKRVVLTN